jgi:nucleoside-diphosphate-sugar epimerase
VKPAVLVTGATGFVGKAVAAALEAEFEVWSLSRPAGAGAPRAISIDLSGRQAVEALRRSLPAEPLEAVLHLAARLPGGGDLESMLATNALGTHRLLAGLPSPPRRLAYFSTVDVYGQAQAKQPISEQSPAAPETEYAVSKYAAERLAGIWCRAHGVPFAIFRLSQVYGVGDPTRKVIPSFCAAVAAGSTPQVHGGGSQLRQPIHVRDVAAATRAWLRRGTGTTDEVFLLAGAERVSVLELARLAMELAQVPGDPVMAPSSGSPPASHSFDFRRTSEALGWAPVVTLRAGLRETIDEARRRSS